MTPGVLAALAAVLLNMPLVQFFIVTARVHLFEVGD